MVFGLAMRMCILCKGCDTELYLIQFYWFLICCLVQQSFLTFAISKIICLKTNSQSKTTSTFKICHLLLLTGIFKWRWGVGEGNGRDIAGFWERPVCHCTPRRFQWPGSCGWISRTNNPAIFAACFGPFCYRYCLSAFPIHHTWQVFSLCSFKLTLKWI